MDWLKSILRVKDFGKEYKLWVIFEFIFVCFLCEVIYMKIYFLVGLVLCKLNIWKVLYEDMLWKRGEGNLEMVYWIRDWYDCD